MEHVGDIEIARTIEKQGVRPVKRRGSRCDAVFGNASGEGSCDGLDDAAGRAHLAHQLVARVRNIEVSRNVHQHARGHVQLCLRCRTAVSAISPRPGTDYGGDHPCRIHLADTVVREVGDVETAIASQRNSPGIIQPAGDCGTAIA